MQGVEVVTSAWKQWGIQALVILSFLLQVMLLVLAESRRRTDPSVLRFFIWSAYMGDLRARPHFCDQHHVDRAGADGILALFLLLHLGGQDNITAYAIEDNQLWLRHLQTFTVQVVAAAYVLYGESSYIVGSRRSLLLPTNIIMFAVGVRGEGVDAQLRGHHFI